MGQDTTKPIITDVMKEMKQFLHASQRENFEDLKQYIDTTLHQKLSLQSSEIRQEICRVKKKVDDLSKHIGQAIDISNNEQRRQLDNHEQRILKIEQVVS
jgi:uncharacterized protein Veg